MKKQLIQLIAAASVLVSVASCHEAVYTPLSGTGTGVAFIAQTQTLSYASQTVTLGNEEVFVDASIRLSDPAAEDCTFSLRKDEPGLTAFNNRKSTTYVPLPEGFYSLTDAEDNPITEVTVAKGQSISPSVRVHVKPLTEEMVLSGQKYALPIVADSRDGKVEMLRSASSMVYVLDRIPIQDVPVINYDTAVYGLFNGSAESFTQWTWETNINMDRLGEGLGQLNNQYIFNIAADQEIYIRFGDAPIDGRVLQIKTQGTQMNSQTMFSQNTWYHIAFVCDGSQVALYVNGQLDNTLDVEGRTYTLSAPSGDRPANFSMCRTTYFRANAMFAEMRFWKVARSQAEIQNNMYSCDPSTEGLLCYYKFNEGEGGDFADSSMGGEAGLARAHAWDGAPQWRKDVRIDGK